MKLFDNKQAGITVVELLVALAISSITILTIYSVFLSGVKAYQKIGIEGFLRDEADYVVSMIINEMNQSSVDIIKYCEGTDNCIELIDSKQINVNNDAKELVGEAEKETSVIIRFIINDTVVREVSEINESTENETLTESSTLSSPNSTFSNSKIEILGIEEVYQQNLSETPMFKSAIINMNLQVGHSRYKKGSPLYVEPLQLESQFGF